MNTYSTEYTQILVSSWYSIIASFVWYTCHDKSQLRYKYDTDIS